MMWNSKLKIIILGILNAPKLELESENYCSLGI